MGEKLINKSTDENGSHTYAYSILFIATFFWGFQTVPLKFLLQEWTAQTITFVRYFLLGGIILSWLYYKRGTVMPPREVWKPLLAMALCLVLNNMIQIAGMKYTTVVNAINHPAFDGRGLSLNFKLNWKQIGNRQGNMI